METLYGKRVERRLAPLVDLRHMKSASPCHACGRCNGHRNAIVLAARSPGREILALAPTDALIRVHEAVVRRWSRLYR
jgi:hypothetical protein